MSLVSRSLAVVAASLASAAGAGPASADKSLNGFWMDSHGEVILEVHSCGEAMCAKVAWLQKPFGPDGQLLLDYRNSDPNLQTRPVCGLTVVQDFKKRSDGTWGDGTVYVSDLGSSFSGYAEILSPNEVKVTGYVLLPIFGESEVWTRHTAPFPHCEKQPPKPKAPAAAQAPAKVPALAAPTAAASAKVPVPAAPAAASNSARAEQ